MSLVGLAKEWVVILGNPSTVCHTEFVKVISPAIAVAQRIQSALPVLFVSRAARRGPCAALSNISSLFVTQARE